jgi:hypothetical protein
MPIGRQKAISVFRSALSNPFATRHMWRMDLSPKTLKFGDFEQNQTNMKEFIFHSHFKSSK